MGITIAGICFDNVTESEVVEKVFDALALGRGGHIMTPNVDILRQLCSGRHGDLASQAALVVADGTPIIWASYAQGTPLRERVTGSSLIWSLAGEAAARRSSVFLLGGDPGIAELASEALRERHPGLNVVGTHCPPVGFEKDPIQMAQIKERLKASSPDLVFVALGHPKQDKLSQEFLEDFPATWFLGCGGALTMAAGKVPRAPMWMGSAGLEWVHRLLHEPRRLFRRYLLHDLPFALGLLARSVRLRWSGEEMDAYCSGRGARTPMSDVDSSAGNDADGPSEALSASV